MDDFLLTIPAGLDQSVLLGILVGLFVLFVLTEAFGWTFVGVAVPGYLASVFIIEPASAVIVTIDAVLTYFVVRGLAFVVSRTEGGADLFGRDRFFVIVLVSVLVRQQTETWLVSAVADTLGLADADPDFAAAMSAIGLVLVPLMANVFWKLKLRRGLLQLVVTVGLTAVIVDVLLLQNTTLSYSAVAVNYENAAIDFLGNAKAYILLLAGAYLASTLNLRYGWDFGGILVPALLTLLWLSPAKLLATGAEALVLATVYRLLERIPGADRLNLEGPRKLVLVFTCGIILKWVLGLVMGGRLPHLRVTDLFGFGYLLPSLLALRIILRRSARRVLTTTFLTSGLAFVLGSVVGFALQLLAPVVPTNAPMVALESSRLGTSVEGIAMLGHIRAAEGSLTAPTYPELVAYDAAWEAVAQWLEHPVEATQEAAREAARAAGIVMTAIPGERPATAYAMVEATRPSGTLRGFEVAALFPGQTGPVVRVDRSNDAGELALAGVSICRRVRCRALVLGGARPADDEMYAATPLGIVVARLGGFPQITLADAPVDGTTPTVHVDRELPIGVDLRALWDGPVELSWESPSPPPLGWAAGTRGLAVQIPAGELRRFVADHGPAPVLIASPQAWFDEQDRRAAPTDGADYTPPSEDELKVFESLVSRLLATGDPQRLRLLAATAASVHYEVATFERCPGTPPCVALIDASGRAKDGWGAVLVRPGEDPGFAVEVPRPQRAVGTRELGLEIWSSAAARVLVVAGADSVHGTPPPDPMAAGNVRTAFHAAHQAIDDAMAPGGGVVLQVAGYAEERALADPLVIGTGTPATRESSLPPALGELFGPSGRLSWLGRPAMAQGAPEFYAMNGSGNAQIRFSKELGSATVSILWFSMEVRQRFVRTAQREHRGHFERLGLVVERVEESAKLRPSQTAGPAPMSWSTEEAIEMAESYARTRNVRRLASILRAATDEPAIDVGVGLGDSTGALFMWVVGPDAAAVIWLGERSQERRKLGDAGLDLDQSVAAASLNGVRSLVIRRGGQP